MFHPKLVPVATLLLAGLARGQLDLPAKPRAAPGLGPGSVLLPPPAKPGDLAPGSAAPLELPLPPVGSASPASDGAAGGGAPGPSAEAGPANDARSVFAELTRQRDLQAAQPALSRLLALGEPGVTVARTQLGSTHAPTLLAAGKVCLIAGASSDRAAVAERLCHSLPTPVAQELLRELLTRDPVLASPQYLTGLLEHDASALRAQAARALESQLSPALLPLLAPLLSSKRTATRALVVELVGQVPDPAAENLLASRLGDPNGEIASRVAALLGTREGGEALLLGQAFPSLGANELRSWDRPRAFALLALVAREEGTGVASLEAVHVPALLVGLRSELPIVAGAAAVALAHVGFRSPASATGTWLDREVPHCLVRYGTGVVFHSDFSSLQPPALRALVLLSGQGFGQDGEAARRWWADNAAGFVALHGVIEVSAESSARLALAFDDGRRGPWKLLGPEAPDDPASARGERRLYLDSTASDRLLSRLRAEGVFGLERPPTRAAGGPGSWISVAIGGQEKRFVHGLGSEPAWFLALLSDLSQEVADNRWQLVYDRGRFDSQRSWWLAERERFSGSLPALERSRELKDLLLSAAERSSGDERTAVLLELERLYQELGVPEGEDFDALLALAASESGPGPRANSLLELARIAAGLGPRGDGAPAPAERLLALGLEHFGAAARPALERIARDLDPAGWARLAGSVRPLARALAPPGLLGSPDSQHRALALALLDDPEPEVELAVLAALARTPIEEARPELVERATEGPLGVRAASLWALARLGGPEVLDLALLAFAETDPELQRASVEALAELADPRSASLLASLLARGPSSPLHAAARRGLKRLGAAGREECLRIARSSSARTRREAVLLLSEEGMPEVVPLLVGLLGEDPLDERVAWELCVLTGTDLRADPSPGSAWARWWEGVVHDDALAWFLAAAERSGRAAPARTDFDDPLRSEGARFLLNLLEAGEPELVERAARELERRLSQSFPRPASAAERAAWRAELAAAVEAKFAP